MQRQVYVFVDTKISANAVTINNQSIVPHQISFSLYAFG